MNAANKGAWIGGIAGAGLGTVLGLPKHRYDLHSGKKVKLTKGQRILNGVLGAFSTGVAGAQLGYSIGNIRDLNRETQEWQRRADDFRKKWGEGGAAWEDFRARARAGWAGGGGHQRRQSYDPNTPVPFKGVKTQAEAKARFHELAFNAHPDRVGGSEERMKEINQAWQAFKKHPKFPKTAMAAFLDELTKIHGG